MKSNNKPSLRGLCPMSVPLTQRIFFRNFFFGNTFVLPASLLYLFRYYTLTKCTRFVTIISKLWKEKELLARFEYDILSEECKGCPRTISKRLLELFIISVAIRRKIRRWPRWRALYGGHKPVSLGSMGSFLKVCPRWTERKSRIETKRVYCRGWIRCSSGAQRVVVVVGFVCFAHVTTDNEK